MSNRPNYGIDAPGVIRNLFVAGGVALVVWASAALGFWSGRFALPLGKVSLVFPLAVMGLFMAPGFLAMALWMIWSSKIGKIREREWMLDHIRWNGNEQVLDVGCGRGLMLIGAAKRLTTGKATGVDIWQKEDLSGNSPEAAMENARCEGVEGRVQVRTADMREMPFADGTFDVAVSCEAIHNIYSSDERAKAVREIARVLKPDGRAVITDIRHLRHYMRIFREHGFTDIRRTNSVAVTILLAIVTMGSLRPATILVQRR